MNFTMRGIACGTMLICIGLMAVGCDDKANASHDGDTTAAVISEPTTETASTAQVPLKEVTASTLDNNLNDASIVALLENRSNAAIQESDLALQKSTTELVKVFATMLKEEHQKLLKRIQGVAGAQNISPASSTGTTQEELTDKSMQALKAMPAGHEFDTSYVSLQIAVHAKAFEEMNDLKAHATNDSLRALVDEAKPLIRMYLDRAVAMRGMIGQ